MNTINNQANIKEPAILLRINKSYEEISQRFQKGGELTAEQLYEAVRGVWRVNQYRGAEYAFAIVGGIIKEIYKVKYWALAYTSEYEYQLNIRKRHDNIGKRWEFTGEIAEESVRWKYLGKSVNIYRNPVKYINC